MARHKLTAPLGASLIVLSSLFYASYGIWTKLMGNFFGGYTASALRSVLVLLILLPIAVTYGQLEAINWRCNWRYLIGMVLSALFIWGPLYYAILHAGIGISLAVNYASIVIGTFFFGWLFIKEQFTKDKLLSACLGLAGLYFVFSPNVSSLGWLALGAASLSGLSGAINMIMAKQVSYNTTQSAIAVWTTSVIANVSMAFVFDERQPVIGWHAQWLYLIGFAIASVIASWSLIKGIKNIDAGAVGILGLLEIVFGVIFGTAFFHERLSGVVLLGILIIIAAAAIPYIKDYDSNRGTLD
ncbi:MAG: DMT family transporter [Candidatus Saccharimonadales bacterium]